MSDAFICDLARTPIGRYAGVLKDVRADDLAAPQATRQGDHPTMVADLYPQVVADPDPVHVRATSQRQLVVALLYGASQLRKL